jgi:stage IV sporulation protein FB
MINFTLLFLAIFIYLSANRERGMASYICMQHLTRKKEELLRKGIMATEQFTALPTTPLRDIIRWFEPQKYHLVYVIDGDCKYVGQLTEADILEGILTDGVETPIGRLIQKAN